jgi:hypothetical protein
MRLEGAPTVVEFDPYQQQAAGAVTGPVIGSQFQYATAHNVGEAVRLADGRTFRYALVGGSNLVAGTINTPAIEKPNHYECTTLTAVTGSAVPTTRQVTVTLGATAAVASEYVHGFATWSSGANVGIPYEISYHPAANSGATLQLTFFDYLQNAVASNDTVDLSHGQWYNVVINSHTTIQTTRVAGVSLIAATATYGAWLVTHGLAPCIADGTVSVGTEIVLSNSTNGAVTGRSTTYSTAVAQIHVGYCGFDSAIVTNSKPIFLDID